MNAMGVFRNAAIVCLLALSVVWSCAGCGDATASAEIDCPMMLKRVKDGVFEIGRRHKTGPRETLMLVESLHDRIAGYEEAIEQCDPDSAEIVFRILQSLQTISAEQQAGAALEQSLVELVTVAESLPVEATPAAEYDD